MGKRNSRRRTKNKASQPAVNWFKKAIGLLSFLLLLILFSIVSLWLLLPQFISLDHAHSLVYYQLDQQNSLAKIYYISFNPILNQVSIQPIVPEFEMSLYFDQEKQTKSVADWWQQLLQNEANFTQTQTLSSFFSSALFVPVSQVEQASSQQNLAQKGELLVFLREKIVAEPKAAVSSGLLKLYLFARQADFLQREELQAPADLYFLKDNQNNCPVAVLNTTHYSGLANYTAQILNNGGIRVIRAASPNFSQEELQEKWGFLNRSQILVKEEKPGCKQAAEVINDALRTNAKINVYSPELDYWFNRYRADLVVILAVDQDWQGLPTE